VRGPCRSTRRRRCVARLGGGRLEECVGPAGRFGGAGVSLDSEGEAGGVRGPCRSTRRRRCVARLGGGWMYECVGPAGRLGGAGVSLEVTGWRSARACRTTCNPMQAHTPLSPCLLQQCCCAIVQVDYVRPYQQPWRQRTSSPGRQSASSLRPSRCSQGSAARSTQTRLQIPGSASGSQLEVLCRGGVNMSSPCSAGGTDREPEAAR
jgi:hypothetical protein